MSPEQLRILFIDKLCWAIEHAAYHGRMEQATELARCLQRVQGTGYVEIIA